LPRAAENLHQFPDILLHGAPASAAGLVDVRFAAGTSTRAITSHGVSRSAAKCRLLKTF